MWHGQNPYTFRKQSASCEAWEHGRMDSAYNMGMGYFCPQANATNALWLDCDWIVVAVV